MEDGTEVVNSDTPMACVIFCVEGKYFIELVRDGEAIRAAPSVDEMKRRIDRQSAASGLSWVLYWMQFSPRVLEATLDELREALGEDYHVAALNGAVYFTRGLVLPEESGKRLYERAVGI